jgi:hypothetical protein
MRYECCSIWATRRRKQAGEEARSHEDAERQQELRADHALEWLPTLEQCPSRAAEPPDGILAFPYRTARPDPYQRRKQRQADHRTQGNAVR